MNKYLLLLSCALLAGCGTLNLFGSKSEPAPQIVASQATGSQKSENCPFVDVRDGAAVYKLTSGATALDVRYQASIGELARECFLEEGGKSLRIRLGIEGKLIVGPKGGAGSLSLPIRVAVQKNNDAPLWNRLYNAPVSVPANTPHVSFAQIENDIIIPLPSINEIGQYTVWVGFDEKAAGTSGRAPKRR